MMASWTIFTRRRMPSNMLQEVHRKPCQQFAKKSSMLIDQLVGEIRSPAKLKPVLSLKPFASLFQLNGKYSGNEHKICCLFSASFSLYKIHIAVDCQIESGLFPSSRLLSITFSWVNQKWGAVKVRVSVKSERLIVLGF